MLIQLDHVTKRYGPVCALDDLSAEIRGDVVGLLGPNGAGKSTLLKSLLGLIEFEGQATVLGLSTPEQSFEIRDRVGYMPEIDSYLADMTAIELCTYAGALSGLPKNEAMQRAHAALYYAGLEEKRYLKVEGYSSGLKQRVKLAQALVHDPELLFLDEPMSGLDPRSRDEMLELISELPRKRGMAIVLSTHLLPDVDRICDSVVIMHRGALCFHGTLDELRQRGGGPDDRVFEVGVKYRADNFASALARAGCDVDTSNHRLMIVRVPPGHDSRLLFEHAKATDTQIRHLDTRRESLEAAFLGVIGAHA